MERLSIPFDELLENFEGTLCRAGYGYSGRLRILKRAGMLVRWHEDAGYKTFNEDIITAYFNDADQRLYDGKIGAGNYRERVRDVQRFLAYAESGNVELTYPLKGSRYTLAPEYQRIADDFLHSGDFHPNTRNDMRWVAHKYFVWLAERGHDDLTSVRAEELQAFLLHCSKQIVPNSMHNVKLYLKKLYAYLYKAGLSESAYAELLSFPVNRESKIYPRYP